LTNKKGKNSRRGRSSFGMFASIVNYDFLPLGIRNIKYSVRTGNFILPGSHIEFAF
jgi:hypothetical protein